MNIIKLRHKGGNHPSKRDESYKTKSMYIFKKIKKPKRIYKCQIGNIRNGFYKS